MIYFVLSVLFLFGVPQLLNAAFNDEKEDQPWLGVYATTKLPSQLGVPYYLIDNYHGITFAEGGVLCFTATHRFDKYVRYNKSYLMTDSHNFKVFLWDEKPWYSEMRGTISGYFSPNYSSVFFEDLEYIKRSNTYSYPCAPKTRGN